MRPRTQNSDFRGAWLVALCATVLLSSVAVAQVPNRSQKVNGKLNLFPGISEEKKERIFAARQGGCNVLLGANGELITLSERSDSNACLTLVPEGETIELVGAFGMRYGVIDKKGNILLEKLVETDFHIQPTLSPKKWPFKDKETGKPAAVPSREMRVIFTPSGKKSATYMPPNAAEWILLAAMDILVVPEKGMERPQNVLWVIRNDHGFQLVHSGPARQGVYLEVDEDGKVFLGTKQGLQHPISASYSWPFYDIHTKTPTLPHPGATFGYKGSLESPQHVFIGDGGVVMIENPPIE